jgi:selenide,water dikinase
VLTKPLGTGILTTALKQDRLDEDGVAEAVRVMATLNRDAATAMNEIGASAATDITGFGLLGHLSEMLRDPGIGARLSAGAMPILAGARELAEGGVAPGGTRKNLLATHDATSWAEGLSEADRLLLADAQTSGGLLIAVPEDRAERLLSRLRELGTPAAAVVGEITGSSGIRIEP